MRKAAAAVLLATAACGRTTGPGQGPWETASPESQGLSGEELKAAEEAVNNNVGGRVCYLVVKNGKIVHETYRGGWSESSTREGYSTTKTQCSSLFGIARQQGWADPNELISSRNSGTRNCNKQATFKNALTMTGTSPDINNPRFSYDTLGTSCLDSLSDFLQENNPAKTSADDWKDRNWQTPLGLEHTKWSGNNLMCGTSSVISCRDLARTAQLWTNEGEWPGAGQLLSKAHVQEGRKVFPQSTSTEYGYTVWLEPNDPVDPERAEFNGMFSQCAHASAKHNTVVVSMGMDLFGDGCSGVWARSRNAIVSKNDRLGLNLTAPAAHQIPPPVPPTDADWILLRNAVRNGTDFVSPKQLAVLNAKLRDLGEKPIA
eukprot:Hpha_TRINITY_DN15122_c1_g16::TRINITY_DN15122_c1_g16_i1::g.129603::m.129603